MIHTITRCPACGHAFTTDLNRVWCDFGQCPSDISLEGFAIGGDETREQAAQRLWDAIDLEQNPGDEDEPESPCQRKARISDERGDKDFDLDR